MGGRGASSGMSKKGNPYGSQYHTLYQSGNIKFIARNPDAREEPLETMTSGRVYAFVNENNKIKSIHYFDKRNKRTKQINLDHWHNKKKPHVHRGYYHHENDPGESRLSLTVREKKMVDRILKTWDNRNRRKQHRKACASNRESGANPGAYIEPSLRRWLFSCLDLGDVMTELKKPTSIEANSFMSDKWDEITKGREFQTSDIPTIMLLCQQYAVVDRCMEDMNVDGDVQVAYQNDIGDLKALPQLNTMKQASGFGAVTF